ARRAGIEPVEAEAVGEIVDDRTSKRRREVDDLAAERSCARIEAARREAGLGQGDQRVADDEAGIAGDRDDVADLGSGPAADEGQPRLQLDVAREEPDTGGV